MGFGELLGVARKVLSLINGIFVLKKNLSLVEPDHKVPQKDGFQQDGAVLDSPPKKYNSLVCLGEKLKYLRETAYEIDDYLAFSLKIPCDPPQIIEILEGGGFPNQNLGFSSLKLIDSLVNNLGIRREFFLNEKEHPFHVLQYTASEDDLEIYLRILDENPDAIVRHYLNADGSTRKVSALTITAGENINALRTSFSVNSLSHCYIVLNLLMKTNMKFRSRKFDTPPELFSKVFYGDAHPSILENYDLVEGRIEDEFKYHTESLSSVGWIGSDGKKW